VQGRRAVELLMAELQPEGEQPQRLELPFELVVRATSARLAD